jgi:beta-galactosidase
VAVLCDHQNRWALQEMQSPVKGAVNYLGTCVDHYAPFWQRGIGVDVPDQTADLSRYKIVIAPELQMLLPGTAERLTAFVENGGILVTTYLTGYVNETDLCFLGGFPGPLRELLGIRIEEIDALPGFRKVSVKTTANNSAGLSGTWEARDICELIHAESAEVLAVYDGEFYAGMPAVTRKQTGRGAAYHIGARLDGEFIETLTSAILREAGIPLPLATTLPVGVTAQSRISPDGTQWMFLMNFNETPATVDLGKGAWLDFENHGERSQSIKLSAFGSRIFTSSSKFPNQ